MPKGRLVFDGDNVYTEKNARVYKLKQEISSRIDAIPGVIDDLNSTSTTDALSANMGRELQDQISALSGNFHFLSTWDCTTGLPGTNPVEDPYNYESGDYYIVSMVAGSGGTNYKPQGGSYVQGVPSTAVETGTVNLSDWYVYDGATWILQPAGSWHIIVDDQLDATSANPVQNRIITQALANKQNTITNLSTIESGAAAGATALQPGDNISSLTNNSGYQTAGDVAAALGDVIHTGTTAPSNPTEGQLWYDTTNDVLKVYDGTQWNVVGVNGSDVNTKTFPLSGTTGATALAEAQAIYDWYVAGKNPLILYNEQIYLFYSELTNSISFITPHNQRSDLGTTSFIMQRTLTLTLSSDTVSGITAGDTMIQGLLMTGYDYPTPYVPEYDGSPSNKKYVDDKVRSAISVIATAPSTPTEGMLWYDTTNDVLKVYDGTQWNIVGGGGTTYTAGDNIDITNDTISAENVIKTDVANDTGFRIEDGELTDGQFYVDTTSPGYVESGFEKDSSSEYVFRFAYLDGGNSMIGVSSSQQDLNTGDEYSFDISIDALTGIVASRSITDDGQTTSTSENYNVFSEYEGDPNKIAKIGDIKNVINSGTTSPSDPTEGQLWYDTTNHVLKVYNGTTWVALDTNTTYTAGTGISINANNEISNTGVLSSNNTYNNIVYLSQSDYDNLQNKDANTLYSTPDAGDVSFVDDTAYAASWDGDTTHAPSKNVVYDKVNSMKEFVASEGAVKVFNMPDVNDDITDIVTWKLGGGTAILYDSNYDYYYYVWSFDSTYTGELCVFWASPGNLSASGYDIYFDTSTYIVTSKTHNTARLVPNGGTQGQVLTNNGNSTSIWADPSSIVLEGGSMGTFIRAAQQAGTKHTINMGTDNTYTFQGVGWVKVSDRWGWACEINDEQMFYESHSGGTYVLKYPAMFITMGQGDKVRLYRPGNAGGCTYEVADYY